jgi:hypothetical protein
MTFSSKSGARLVQIGHYYVRETTNFSEEEGYPPRTRTSPNDMAGLLQRTAAVEISCSTKQKEARLLSRTWLLTRPNLAANRHCYRRMSANGT